MKEKTETFDLVNRTGFPDGPWKNEPDRVTWIDPATSYPCAVIRTNLGHLCGYVGVGELHPWFRIDDSSIAPAPEVHGGLTFSDFRDGDLNVWWIGFDAAHMGDMIPSIARPSERDAYKSVAFMTAESTSLAGQAMEAYHVATKN